MKSGITVVSTPTADSPGTTLLLHFDTKRYLFGQISEGSQRCFAEAGLGVKKVSNIFITGKCEWQNVGGLIGMILTLADVRATAKEAMLQAREEKKRSAEKRGVAWTEVDDEIDISLDICGPPNLVHSVAAARRFVFRKGLPLNIREVRSDSDSESSKADPAPSWTDENIKVWSMCVCAESVSADPQLRPRPSRSLSGRKRKFDEANGKEPPHLTGAASIDAILQASESEQQREENEQWVRQNVITSMFGSNWSLDKLDEIDLRTAKLPARLWVRDPETKDLKEYIGPLPGGSDPVPDIKVLVRRPWPGALIQHLPPTRPKAEATSYIVAMHPRRGKFDPKKALALGLKPGPEFSRLASGETLKNGAGEEVRPEQVLGPDQQGAGFAIVDLPTMDYVTPLINRPEWKAESVSKGLGVIHWILGPGVAGHPGLQEFIAQHPDVKHSISSTDFNANELVLQKAAKISIGLAQIDDKFYSTPYFDNETLPQPSYLGTQGGPVPLPKDAQVAERNLQFILEPKFKTVTSEITPRLSITKIIEECLPEVSEIAKKAQAEAVDNVSLKEWQSMLACPNTEIITLGTGSAIPSNYRNVSATLVRVPGYGNYLLDCGENTLGQLQRVFTPSELAEVLCQLRMIWISHMHADHHLGTVSLIKAWWRTRHGDGQLASSIAPVSSDYLQSLKRRQGMDPAGQSPIISPYLAVVSDQQYMHYLSEYASVEDFGYSHVLPLAITSARVHQDGSATSSYIKLSHHDCDTESISKKLYPDLLGVQDIQACDVKHCHGAKGLAMTWPRETTNVKTGLPLKLSYSGDCRPSSYLANIGKNSTVLVHEATFDDELKGEARAKNHSTTSEALDIGRQMGAPAVVLTHFSQRYGKIPGAEWSGVASEKGSIKLQEEMAKEQAEIAKDALPGWGEVGKQPDASDSVQTEIKPEAVFEQGSREPADALMAEVSAPISNHTNGESSIDDAALNGLEPDSFEPNMDAIVNVEAPQPPGASEEQEPPYIPSTSTLLDPVDSTKEMKVCVAFDYMRVRIGEIGRMQMLRPALVKLFEEEIEEEAVDGEDKIMTDAASSGQAKMKANKSRQKQEQRGKDQIGVVEGEMSKRSLKKLRDKELRAADKIKKQVQNAP